MIYALTKIEGAKKMTKPWRGATALIVDDSAKIRDELTAALTTIGLKVIKTAGDGYEALEYLKANTVDVVTIDVIMPIMHGIELYRELKLIRPEQKAFFVTLLAREKKFIEGYKDEIPEELFQGKPFTVNDLEQKLAYVYNYSESTSTGSNEDVPLKPEFISHQFQDG